MRHKHDNQPFHAVDRVITINNDNIQLYMKNIIQKKQM